MPHVVLKGNTRIEDVFKELKPIFVRSKDYILRTTDVYLDRGKTAILIDSLAIEADKKTVFLVMITARDDGVVVRLYPKIEVEKTGGVKQTLAELAKQLLASFPELKVGETNLGDYLK